MCTAGPGRRRGNIPGQAWGSPRSWLCSVCHQGPPGAGHSALSLSHAPACWLSCSGAALPGPASWKQRHWGASGAVQRPLLMLGGVRAACPGQEDKAVISTLLLLSCGFLPRQARAGCLQGAGLGSWILQGKAGHEEERSHHFH